ncbi:MAG: endonuclease/exonuclease/phosphatase family protein [Verrucomicrobiales bacterium]|nr:endonuclease/exonuclease/phosphatase family protein [Verrucomicrobiales bacterium]
MKTPRFLWILLFLFTCSTISEAEELSAMSFNIRYGKAKDGDNAWPHRKELVAETIQRFSPDLLGLQESLDFQVDFLAKQLPEFEVYSVPRTPDGGESCAIFFRKSRFEKLDEGTFWLSETPDQVASKSWDSSLPRIVSWVRLQDRKNDRELFFANTHFDHRGTIAREMSAKLIRKRLPELAGSTPFLLTGDFNCIDGSPPQEALLGDDGKFLDTYREIHPEIAAGKEGTFTGFQATDNGKRIDWILCSPGFTIESAAIDRFRKNGRVPSDHYPVTTVLRFAEKK